MHSFTIDPHYLLMFACIASVGKRSSFTGSFESVAGSLSRITQDVSSADSYVIC